MALTEDGRAPDYRGEFKVRHFAAGAVVFGGGLVCLVDGAVVPANGTAPVIGVARSGAAVGETVEVQYGEILLPVNFAGAPGAVVHATDDNTLAATGSLVGTKTGADGLSTWVQIDPNVNAVSAAAE